MDDECGTTIQQVKAIEKARKVWDFIQTIRTDEKEVCNTEGEKVTRETVQGVAMVFFDAKDSISPTYYGWIDFKLLNQWTIIEAIRRISE